MLEQNPEAASGGAPAAQEQIGKSSKSDQQFVWNTGFQPDERRRIFIKEEALKAGIEQCKKLIDEIKLSFTGIEELDDSFARSIWSQESRVDWILKCESIIKDHRSFSVLVGVSGRTGSGKTSALNALLGYQELLPTSNEEASTAVPCRIEYNYDNDPNKAFRCEVFFRNKSDVKRQLDQFVEDRTRRNELRASCNRTVEDEEELRNYNSELKPSFEMIQTVFGISNEQAETLDSNTILRSRPEVVALLGKKKQFHDSQPKGIAEKIKPYMDSTEADHSKTGLEFAAWPLIDEVRLFVKSNVLENGVVLVDLPGAADAVESRSAVAERYSDQLTATLVVAEAKRAASDSTNVDLISKHREMAMMLDGKFHKRSFCVCVSQMDSISVAAALRKKDAKDNGILQSWAHQEGILKEKRKDTTEKKKNAVKEVKAIEKDVEKNLKKLEKCKGNGTKQRKLDAATEAHRAAIIKLAAHKARRDKLDKGLHKLEDDIKELSSKIAFACIKARNAFLEAKLNKDFGTRQAKLVCQNDKGSANTYDGKVSVCPISAHAFWKCRKGEEHMIGFPKESYTGIPNLVNWIRTATIPKREEHADELLHRLQIQYNVIRLWSRDEWGRNRIKISREDFQRNVLEAVFSHMKQSLDGYWRQLERAVAKHNPLHDDSGSFETCTTECRGAVIKWAFKNADNEGSSSRVHWQTYRAMVKRRGAKYLSKSGNATIEYNWMQDISYIFLSTIVRRWNLSLNHDIPALAESASPKIDAIWDEFLQRLRMGVDTFEMNILGDWEAEIPALEAIKERVKDNLRGALKSISRGATDIRPDLVEVVRKQWEPAFRQALKSTGKGSYKAQQAALLSFAGTKSQGIFKTAFINMQGKLNKSFNKLPQKLSGVSSDAVKAVEAHISILLDKIIEPTAANPVKLERIVEMREQMQKSIRTILLDWDIKWQVPDTAYGFAADMGESRIPKEYRSMKTEDGAGLDDMDMDPELEPDTDVTMA